MFAITRHGAIENLGVTACNRQLEVSTSGDGAQTITDQSSRVESRSDTATLAERHSPLASRGWCYGRASFSSALDWSLVACIARDTGRVDQRSTGVTRGRHASWRPPETGHCLVATITLLTGLSLRVPAALRSSHRLAVSRDRNLGRDCRLAIYFGCHFECVIVDTLVGWCVFAVGAPFTGWSLPSNVHAVSVRVGLP